MSAAPELCARIFNFAIDEGTPALTFERRLARENGWTAEFACRVVIEYKRFVYLAMTAGHPVTPSDQVDQAWHLHLTYSRSYWERLCGEVLGRPLHHGPTRGGAAESARFDAQYEQTLAAYRTAFGAEPPADIWPPAEVRFGTDLHFVRVNTALNWVVPKGPVKRGVALAAIAAAVFATGCDPRLNPFALVGLDFLWFFLPLVLVALAFAVGARHHLHGPGATSDAPELDWADAAYLSGGFHRVAAAAVARLAADGCVRVASEGRLLEPVVPLERALSDVERAVHASLPLSRIDRSAMKVMTDRVSDAFAARAHELTAEGYRVPLGRRCLAAAAVAPLAFVVGFGFPRWAQAVQAHVRCGALGTTLLLAAVACVLPLVLSFRRCSRRGCYALRRLRAATDRTDPQSAGMSVALFGTTALAGCSAEEVAALGAWYPRTSGTYGGGCGTGCGSGDGGGGCGGGGCGGCGGCGG